MSNRRLSSRPSGVEFHIPPEMVQAMRRSQQLLIQLGQAVTPIMQIQREIARRTQPYIQLAQSAAALLEQHQSQIIEFLALLDGLDDRARAGLASLAEHGWYFDEQMSIAALFQSAGAFDDEPEAMEAALCGYFTQRLYAIERELSVAYPHRRELLRDAFGAHLRGLYNLSIPVFIAQADGIWRDQLKRNLFSNGGPAHAVIDYQQSVHVDGIGDVFLSPLSMSAPLWRSEKDRDASFSELNRHQVLHGEVIQYGTETNSLKAVSFLNYVHLVLSKAAVAGSSPT